MPTLTHPRQRSAPYRVHWLVLPLAALLAIVPMLRDGPSCGHDFDFHLLSWFEAAHQFAHGNLHPHWATLPAYGAGEPRFVFYPPVSWTLGGVLTGALTHLPHLSPAAGFNAVPILLTWIALSAAGLALFALARRYTHANAALFAAILYLSNPYLLFTAYERTAFAELLSAALLPLVLAAVLPLADPAEPPSIPRVSLPVAALWLTNAPAAVMGSYSLALIVLLRVVALRRTPRTATTVALRSAVGTLLGLALAAFYLVPAVLEQRWVEISMAVTAGMRPADNTLFHHTLDPDHDAVLHTASLIAVVLLIATAAFLITGFARSRKSAAPRPPLPYLTGLAALIAVLLTPVSLPLWRYLPELAFLQFPWRLLAVLSVAAALAAALALHRIRFPVALAATIALLIPAAIAIPTASHFLQGCDTGESPREAWPTFATNFNVPPTDEYTPDPADNDALRHNNPPFRLAPDPDSPVSGIAQPGTAPRHLDLAPTAPGWLILNLRDYPAWRITVNGHPTPHGPKRDDGLLTIELPAGHDHIDLIYANTPDLFIGESISFAALLSLAVLLVRRRRQQGNARAAGPAYIINA